MLNNFKSNSKTLNISKIIIIKPHTANTWQTMEVSLLLQN